MNEENAAALFEACRVKTRRQIEHLLAARVPRPDVRGQIRRLPAPSQVRVEAISQPLPPPHVFKAPRVLVVSRFVKAEEKDASALALVRVRLALERSGQAARSRRPHQAEFQPRHAQTMRQLVRRVPNNSRSARAMFPRRFGEKSMLETALNAHSSRPMAGAATRRPLLEFDRVKPFA